MATIDVIVPGSGIIGDEEEDIDLIIPGVGIYGGDSSAAAVAAFVYGRLSMGLDLDL